MKIFRREFAKRAALIGAGLFTPDLFTGKGKTMNGAKIKVNWTSDYQAIVDPGRKLGIRPQAATILCEWD